MTLAWLVFLIPVPPLIAFFAILLFTRRSRFLSDLIAVSAILLTWVFAIIVLIGAFSNPHLGENPIEASLVWLPLGPSLESSLRMGVLVDPLGAVMLFFVPLTASMIFIYSTGYMDSGSYWTEVKNAELPPADAVVDSAGRTLVKFDASAWKARFMAFIALFAAAMLILSVADNLLLLFVGWELMGFCSYALIGFWHNRVYPDQPGRITPVGGGIKAFMTTRVADVVMLLGIAWLYSFTGTLNFREILYNEATLAALEMSAFPNIAALGGLTVAGAVGLLIFAGTVGKSAQFPLHTWLPDAMEGPTPVSAMIHAATMVSAGIYLILRMFPLLSVGWDGDVFTLPMQVIATVGAFTALFAATIALAQRDIKKVLAYSTISQLGYMVAAVGIGAYVAAAFHLMTHAIFKALLFMGSGSVIHAVDHGEEHAKEHGAAHVPHGHSFPLDFDAQDMFNMGGLWKRVPVTAWTFLIGGLALSGFPLITAGFWSKDEILADAYAHAPGIFIVLAVAALLTAFYTMRLIGLTFAGSPRTAAAEEAEQTDLRMNLPLVVLAVFAIIAGYVGVHEDFPLLGRLLGGNPFHRFVSGTLLEHPETLPFDFVPLLISIAIAMLGLFVGWLVYVRKPLEAGQPDPLKRALGPVYTLLENKYYIDELYDLIFVRPSIWLAEKVVYQLIDRGIIDGFLHFVARAAEWIAFRHKDFDTQIINEGTDNLVEGFGEMSDSFKYIQSGRIQQYLAVAVAGLLMLVGVFVWSLFIR
ncbi:MAG: NADH-quinone oxidoreductase subunit L [Anaerolineae bacterium]|nr:NADH-quinone oxidoreductase subunit L [Anaerolineae bacterium]